SVTPPSTSRSSRGSRGRGPSGALSGRVVPSVVITVSPLLWFPRLVKVTGAGGCSLPRPSPLLPYQTRFSGRGVGKKTSGLPCRGRRRARRPEGGPAPLATAHATPLCVGQGRGPPAGNRSGTGRQGRNEGGRRPRSVRGRRPYRDPAGGGRRSGFRAGSAQAD